MGTERSVVPVAPCPPTPPDVVTAAWDTPGVALMLAQTGTGHPAPRPLGDALPGAGAPSLVGDGAGDTSPLGDIVADANDRLAEVLRDLEPARITGPDAVRLYSCLAAVERLAAAGRTLLAPRIEESGVWRDSGHPSPASLLATLEGVPTGQARRTLEVGHRLHHLPGTEDALRRGALSGPKAAELTGAAILDPGTEQDLLAGAGEQPLQEVKERCRRARAAAAEHDPIATTRRIRAARHFTSWTDAEGAFCYQGRDTAERGARMLHRIEAVARGLRSSGGVEVGPNDDAAGPVPGRAHRADAFYLLMTRGPSVHEDESGDGAPRTGRPPLSGDRSGSAEDLIDRPPTCTVMVRVDLDALLRGAVGPGEICEIDGHGPIPVPMARDMANDAFLAYVFHRAGEIRAISHFGRTINRRLRTALVHRDRTCVVPGCDVAWGLEIDHVVPFAEGGPTALDNLALLCHHHHFLKTFEGWTLERTDDLTGGPPGWTFTPLPAFGQEPGLGADLPGP